MNNYSSCYRYAFHRIPLNSGFSKYFTGSTNKLNPPKKNNNIINEVKFRNYPRRQFNVKLNCTLLESNRMSLLLSTLTERMTIWPHFRGGFKRCAGVTFPGQQRKWVLPFAGWTTSVQPCNWALAVSANSSHRTLLTQFTITDGSSPSASMHNVHLRTLNVHQREITH